MIPATKKSFDLDDDSFILGTDIIRDLIENYTYEVGVRQLKRLIEKLSIGFLRKKISKEPSLKEIKDYLLLFENRIPYDSYTADRHFSLYPGRSLGV